MPRPANHAKHVALAVGGLLAAVTGLVVAVKAASSRGGVLPARVVSGKPVRKKNPKHAAALKAAWARLTPAQLEARRAAMRAGHRKAKRAKR